MTGDWDSYLCEIDGKPGSVIVDLSLFDAPDMSQRTLLGRVAFKIDAPDAFGFPDAEEYKRLEEHEKNMTAALCKDLDCVYAGRVINAGTIQCFFYLEESRADAWLARMREQKGATGSCVDADPAWECYKNLLYPDDITLLEITNRRACEQLAELEVDTAQVRTIEHVAEFESEANAIAFSTAVINQDFITADPRLAAENKAVYSVRFSRPDAPDEIHGVTLSLDGLARQHSGTYRGWWTTTPFIPDNEERPV